MLWPRTANPVRYGLLASAMCTRMAEVAETDFETLSAKAAEFEAQATGVLDHMPSAVAMSSAGVHFLARDDKVWGLLTYLLTYLLTTSSHATTRSGAYLLTHLLTYLPLPRTRRRGPGPLDMFAYLLTSHL